MKIAFDGRALGKQTSGVGTYAENLLKALFALEPKLEVLLITRQAGIAERFGAANLRELVFTAEPRSFRTLYALPLRLRAERFDLFHGPFNILPSGLACPTVVTVHDLMQLQNPANIAKSRFVQQTAGLFWRTRIRHAITHANAVLTVSQATRDVMLEYFPELPETRVTAAPIGVDESFFTAPAAADLERARALLGSNPFVLTVGNESPHKNHYRAILAFMEAFGENTAQRFVMVRRSLRHDPELEQLLQRPAVKRNVVVLDYADAGLLRALYRLARTFFFPSWVEGFGIPVLEAMASGTPVVTSDRSSLVEVAGDAGLTVSPFSVSAMAEALRRADQEEALRAELIQRGRERARTFTWQRCAEATLRVYEQVAANGFGRRLSS